MSQETKQGGDSTPKARTPMVVQGYAPPHIAPGYEHLFCQCGCGAPVEAAGEVHAAAAQRQPHQPGHLAPQFRSGAGGQGMVQPLMYPAQYPTQQDMQFQSQFAAAAAMTQYASYERMDPYRNAHMPYRPPMELPRGYMVPTAPGAASYLAPAPQLNYFRHYPGMMHMVGGADNRAEQNATAGAGGVPPEAAPPPPNASPPTSTNPKESILGSLLAARSERQLSAASAEAEEAPAAKEGVSMSPPATRGSAASKRKGSKTAAGFLDDDASADAKTESKPAAGTAMTLPHFTLATNSTHIPAGGGESVGGLEGPGAAAKSAVATAAATAMHLTGLRGGFAAEMRRMGGPMPGMAPPLSASVTVAPAGTAIVSPGAPPSMNAMQYMTAAALPPPPPPQVASVSPTQSLGFASNDTFEEHVRQQEKKLQKRAANRKSAQLSRKRKKALIEELRYENQDLQRHQDILEVIPDPVFAFDTATGRVWFASNSASAQFGLSVEDLTSACFFDLMTDDCSKRLRVLIDTAVKDVSETNSALLHERMTVRFKKRKAAILLGELSGRLSRQGDVTTAVCSVRPLSLATDEIVGKGYIGDASMSDLAEDTSADQGSSGEDSRSAGTAPTSGSNADSSSGLGTGCTSIADEASSSGVPSLSSLEVKRRSASGRAAGSGGSTTSSGTGSAGGAGGTCGAGGSTGGSTGGGSTSGSTGGATGEGSTGSAVSGASEEGGAYNSSSDSAPSSGLQEGDDEMRSDSDDGGRRSKRRRTVSESSGRSRSAGGGSSPCYPSADGMGSGRGKGGNTATAASGSKQRYSSDGGASQAPRPEVATGKSMDDSVRPKWGAEDRSERVGAVGRA